MNDTAFPALSFNSIHPVPFLMDSLNVTLIVLLIATFVALFAGSTLFIMGAVPSVVNVLPQSAILFPDKSVKLPVCKVKVYLVPLARLLVGVTVSTLPLIDLVNDTAFPLLSLSSIQLFPAFIASLNVTLIILLIDTFTALFEGSTLFIVGAVLSAVLVVTIKLAVLFELLVIFEFVVFAVETVADTLSKLSNAILKKISIAKNIFFVILPPPDPKTMSMWFHNLISYVLNSI